MFFKLIITLTLFFGLFFGDAYSERDVTKATAISSTGFEVVSLLTGPCGLIPSWVTDGLSLRCKNDFNLYAEAICDTDGIRPNPKTNQSIFDNLWAYKSELALLT